MALPPEVRNIYHYEASPIDYYALKRDGKEVQRGTEGFLWWWLQNNHSYSVDHALKNEGYSIVPLKEYGPLETS